MPKTFAQLSPQRQRDVMTVVRLYDDHTLDRAWMEHGDYWPMHLMGKCQQLLGAGCPHCRKGQEG